MTTARRYRDRGRFPRDESEVEPQGIAALEPAAQRRANVWTNYFGPQSSGDHERIITIKFKMDTKPAPAEDPDAEAKAALIRALTESTRNRFAAV